MLTGNLRLGDLVWEPAPSLSVLLLSFEETDAVSLPPLHDDLPCEGQSRIEDTLIPCSASLPGADACAEGPSEKPENDDMKKVSFTVVGYEMLRLRFQRERRSKSNLAGADVLLVY